MSGISSINGTSSLWSSVSTSTSASSSTSDALSQIVSNLQSGGSGSGSDSSDEDTVTTTRVLSDGSVLVTVMKDGKIVSETKTRSSNSDEQAMALDPTKDPTKAAASVTMDKFNDTSSSIMTGSLFSSDV